MDNQAIDSFKKVVTRPIPLNKYVVGLVVFWTIMICVSLLWNTWKVQEGALEQAKAEARGVFNKDLVYRRWAASHGGVYVPKTDITPSNPYLAHMKMRDLELDSGKTLTLVNPAYMTRQVHEMSQNQYGIKGHITSLTPLRPENKPDNWEFLALNRFKNGEKEVSEISYMDGIEYVRLMRPMFTEQKCLKCHAIQGYKVGDFQGGISVSVPFDAYKSISKAQIVPLITWHVALWLFGLSGLGFSCILLRRRIMEREIAENTRDQALINMSKRIKELDCLYQISETIQKGGELEEILQNVANITPVGWQYPEITECKIVFNGREYCSGKFKETDWMLLSKMVVGKVEYGVIKVFYKEEKPLMDEGVFLKEERALLNGIARLLGETIESKLYESAKARLEDKLQRANRLESVGRLAGGVAHDFNNLLTSITGNIQLAQMDITADDNLNETLDEINIAADRASDLTRQLLAFSRKQIIKPKNINLNELIENMKKMLIRLIKEDIDLRANTNKDIGSIKADPGQIEQIIVNLTVNARDAMPDGGKLTIETESVFLDEEYCKKHTHVNPGDYVMLAVSDSGHGMDEDTCANIFEPFFTTKKEGEGTGLGLATVYGIVKQHQGSIEVYSEVDQGTSFKVFFPSVEEKAEAISRTKIVKDHPTGTETILLVEDNEMVRSIAIRILGRLGYDVINAEDGITALAIMEKGDLKIDLLLTDVVMPNMNGRELARELRKKRPNLKVLYTSGYTEEVIAHHGILDEGLDFIGKPYTPLALSTTVRKILDEE